MWPRDVFLARKLRRAQQSSAQTFTLEDTLLELTRKILFFLRRMEIPGEERWSLTGVPLDILVLVAKALLPYDLLSLSSTCTLLRPFLYDKALWLSIATSLSFHRPLPFTASQALALPVETVLKACLRTERVAKKWSWNSDIHSESKGNHIKIAFPDKRNIPYFTILPGAHRIMAFDMKNTLSCWSIDGSLLGSYQVRRGARLTRWKPIDESDSQFDSKGGAMKYTVEVMVEHMNLRSQSTRYEVILLKYDDDGASFALHEQFRLPSVYEPDSAMSQDELWGALVHFSGDHTERFGIYLVDRHAKKAICIDPGIVPDFPPQALISSKYLVLYWENSGGPRSYAYKMPTLRSVIATHGLHCDGDDLHRDLSIPVHTRPDEEYFASFNTVRRPSFEPKEEFNKSGTTTDATAAASNLVDEETMMRNSDWYPIVIPKWTTMKDDLTAHWTRSVMTLSRRPSPTLPQNPGGVGPLALNEIFPPFPPMQNVPVPNGVPGPVGNGQNGLPFGINMPQLMQMAAAQAQALLNNQLNGQMNQIPPPAWNVQLNGVIPPQEPPLPPPPPPQEQEEEEQQQQQGNVDEAHNNDDTEMPQLLDVSDSEDESDGDEDEVMADMELEDDVDDAEDDDLPPLLPAADILPDADLPPPPLPNNIGHFHVHHGRAPARLMTITHHYYSFTDKEPMIKRTLIAEARIRQPRNPHHIGVVGFDVFVNGADPANMQFVPLGMGFANDIPGANPDVIAGNENPEAQPLAAGVPAFPGIPGFPFAGFPFGQGQQPLNQNPNPGGGGPQMGGWFGPPIFMGWNAAAIPPAGVNHLDAGEGDGNEGAAGPGAAPAGVPGHPFFQGPLGLPNEVPQEILDAMPDDLGGGTPVMGYGGRCALWVQEGEGTPQNPSTREGIVKIATFPSHALRDIPSDRHASLLESYNSLEKAEGNLCTVHLPKCVDVENALAFDLDDVRGVVGVSNSKGEIWLIDYS